MASSADITAGNICGNLVAGFPVVLAVDVSGSTKGIATYHNTVKSIYEAITAKFGDSNIKILLWNHVVRIWVSVNYKSPSVILFFQKVFIIKAK